MQWLDHIHPAPLSCWLASTLLLILSPAAWAQDAQQTSSSSTLPQGLLSTNVPGQTQLTVTNVVTVTNQVYVTNIVVTTNVAFTEPGKNMFAYVYWDDGLNYRLTQRVSLGWANESGARVINEQAKLSGRIGMKGAFDAATYIESGGPQDIANDASVRTLRFYTTGQFGFVITNEFKVDLGVMDNEFYLHEVALRWPHIPYVKTIVLGYFSPPQMLDNLNPFGSLALMEAGSPVQAFGPGRRLGLQLGGPTLHDRVSIHGGLFSVGQSADLNHGDSTKALARPSLRITGLPLWRPEEDSNRLLHLGGSLTYVLSDSTFRYRSRPESQSAPFLVDTGDIDGRNALIAGAEAAYVHGPLTLQGEFTYTYTDQSGGPPLNFWGAYGQAAWMLTGETRPYDRREGLVRAVTPKRNFSFKHGGGPGAFELAMRWSYLNLSDGPVNGGRMNILMPGLNWYWNKHVRFQFNYGYVTINGGPSPDDLHIFQGRVQLNF